MKQSIVGYYTFMLYSNVHHQEILNSDENSYTPENLDPDTEYLVTVTAIYPDESESEDLIGSERTRKRPSSTDWS